MTFWNRKIRIVAVLIMAGLSASARATTIPVAGLSSLSTAGPTNSAIINAAVATGQIGDTVQLPTGSYPIGSSIQLKTGVNVTGAGQSQTTLQYSGTVSQPLVNDSGASNLRLSGFTLDGLNSTAASEGISAQNCAGISIQSVTVQNLTRNADANAAIGPQGIYFIGNVTGSEVIGDTFNNIGKNSNWGAAVRVSAGSNNNQFSNNTIAKTGRGGILCNDSTGNSIVGNVISGSGLSTAGLGIEVQGCANSLIQNNTVDHWISVDTSSGSAVRGNTVSDLSGTFKLAGLELVDSQNVVFSHNAVNGGAQVGISISGDGVKSQIYFGHNSVNAANTWGAQLQGGAAGANEIYFEGNTFTNTTNGPNALYSNVGVGFRINGDAHFVTLSNTTVTGNAGAGVQVSKADDNNVGNLTFRNTIIKNNGDIAVDQDNGIPDVQWTNSTSSGNAYSNTIPASTGSTQPQPIATINVPSQMTAGSRSTFSLKFSDGGGSAGNVLWDFGDGLPATGSTADHTFNVPGMYDVAVIAWDQAGYAAQAEFEVTVTPEPCAGFIGAGVTFVFLGWRRASLGRCRSEVRTKSTDR